ncbi:MAG: zinc ribbon domain-containing protein [Anaerolineales bacterium]|nr:zinc ribbon domain-containing protein [Anaerolineales bacterium]
MDIGSLFLVLALFILVAIFIARPFSMHQSVGVTEEEQSLSSLLAEKERILDALAELEFDYKLGKVPEEVYPDQRANLMQRGADVLRRIDEFQEDEVETAIAARRVKQGSSASDEDLEALIAQRRTARAPGSAKFCPQCGAELHAGDRFCANCGAQI